MIVRVYVLYIYTLIHMHYIHYVLYISSLTCFLFLVIHPILYLQCYILLDLRLSAVRV